MQTIINDDHIFFRHKLPEGIMPIYQFYLPLCFLYSLLYTTLHIINFMNTFQITSSLEHIYPDIENELCSKQTVTLNLIQKIYKQIYPMYPPTHYTIANNVLSIVKSSKSSLSLALEEGVIITFAAEKQGKHLYISSNIFQQQIAMQNNGKLLNSQTQNAYLDEIKKMIQLATQDLSLNTLNGGFLYIHCFDTIHKKEMMNSLLIGLFMSIISINDMTNEYEIDELKDKLESVKQLNNCNVQAYFHGYNNRQLLYSTPQQYTSIKLDSKYKFLFLKYNYLFSGQSVESYINNHEGQYQATIKQHLLDTISIESFFSKVQKNQKQIIGGTQAYQFMSELKDSMKMKGFILCENYYCVYLVQNNKFAQLLGKVSAKIRAKKNNPIEDIMIMNRFKSDKNLNAILFSSVPSKSLSILDPSQSIWF